jgi:hypothetical protein
VQDARQLLLDNCWDLVICLTDIPLRSGDHRPLTAIASATDGVGLISVPALGAIAVEDRVPGGGARPDRRSGRPERRGPREHSRPPARARVADRHGAGPRGQNDPLLDRGDPGQSAAADRHGAGNHPWRVTVKLSRALVATRGTAAYVLASSGFWTLASYMTWPRLLGLALAALVTTSVALIAAHNLWEHSAGPHARERAVLFNAVTTLTIAIGVLTLYLALLAFSVVGAFSLVPQGALNAQINRAAAGDYLRLAWLATSLATLARALGSLIESDLAVREAAYGYRPSQEAGDARAVAGEQGG